MEKNVAPEHSEEERKRQFKEGIEKLTTEQLSQLFQYMISLIAESS